jgi:exodeoxyribonuclease VII large subunit
LTRASVDVAHTRARLLALSPAATLKRGYAIVQADSGDVVRAASEVADAAELTVRFAEDQLRVRAVHEADGQLSGQPGDE